MSPTDTLREAVARALEPKCYGLGDTKRLMSLELTDAALSAIEAAGWRVVKMPSVDDIEALIVATEPDVPACVDGSKIWTLRMAKALHDRLAAPRLDATVRSGEEG